MGYDVSFEGRFNVTPDMTAKHAAIIRDAMKDNNRCDWVLSADGTQVGWNGCEKFNDYLPTIKWAINAQFRPLGYTLNGVVAWDGEEQGDYGLIKVVNNEVAVNYGMAMMQPDLTIAVFDPKTLEAFNDGDS